MVYIIFSLYFLFLLSCLLVYFFITYHLLKYALNPSFSRIAVTFFSVVSLILLISNIILFSSIDWTIFASKLLSNNFNNF
jgi:hypothetical protein